MSARFMSWLLWLRSNAFPDLPEGHPQLSHSLLMPQVASPRPRAPGVRRVSIDIVKARRSLLSGCLTDCGQSRCQFRLRDTLNFDSREADCRAHHDAHAGTRHAGELGEEAHALVVRLAVDGRGGERKLPRVAQAARQGGAPGAWMYLYRETRHATLALKFATPAATRVSTTSKAMVSSSQSWLEPSESCVATVRVYCCGVSQQASWKSTSSSSPAAKSPSGIFSIRVLVP